MDTAELLPKAAQCLVTNNTHEFARVPNLRIANWTLL